jgi:NhaC family Na+:H+ antiporter
MGAVLGVPTLSYLPYAFFNIASPLIGLAYGFTGFKITKLDQGQHADAALESQALEHAHAPSEEDH